MTTFEYYRDETVRLRSNIDTLRQYAEERETEYDNNGDGPTDSFRRGMSAVYGDMARKLAVAAHCEIEETKQIREKLR